MEIKTIKYGGVSVKSDIGVYCNTGRSKSLLLLSIYGASQQVKAIFSALSANKDVSVSPDDIELSRPDRTLRGKGWPIGYGKQHMLIWDEGIRDYILYMNNGEDEAFERFIRQRVIPYSKEYLPGLKKMLLSDDKLIQLGSWGDCGGYLASFEDDIVCSDFIEKVICVKRRKDGSENIPE